MKKDCWNCQGKGKIAFHDGRTVTPNVPCKVCNAKGTLKY